MTDNELIEKAFQAKANSYSPYSDFAVGAALLAESGKVYLGTNVENSSYGATICAERSAICSAVSYGERKFLKIAVVSGNELCPPCGICLQVLSEFCDGDFVILQLDKGEIKSFTLKDFLPNAFKL